MASTYQCIQADLLNQVPKANGVDDAAIRRAICGQFLFDLGQVHDQEWFETVGRRVHPLLCFSGPFLDPGTDASDLGDVHAPSHLFALHDHATGNTAWYFDEHGEDASGIARGPAGSEPRAAG